MSTTEAPRAGQDLRQVRAAGRGEFGALVEPHRRELLAHCYRMSGSLQDAEDLVQETFLRAWRRRETYAGRAPLRAWLYKIATHACLDALARRPRRGLPMARLPLSPAGRPPPPQVNEPIWLEPFPDDLLAAETDSPEAAFARRESISLAFMAAMHRLPPRQRAVLILRDVLEWRAGEVADLLDVSVPAVKSALHRARTGLARHRVGGAELGGPQSLDERQRAQLERYVRAWEQADVEALLGLLADEATFSMPPVPAWYRGRAAIGALAQATVFQGDARGRWRLLPTRANGQAAFGVYMRERANGPHAAHGVQVLRFAGERIAGVVTFIVPALNSRFGLPETLAG